VVRDIVRRAPRRLRWAPHNLVVVPVHHLPCLHLWPSIITWRSRNPAKRWYIVGLCTTRLCGGGSLLYDSSYSFSTLGQGVPLPTNRPSHE
jgi:hypothetical protein